MIFHCMNTHAHSMITERINYVDAESDENWKRCCDVRESGRNKKWSEWREEKRATQTSCKNHHIGKSDASTFNGGNNSITF